MKKIAFQLFLLSVVALAGVSCKDDYVYNDLVQDNLPSVPVTFTGATTYGFDPYYETSVAGGGTIKITLSIPASSGRTIKEITKVAAGATSINAGTLTTAGNYNTAPIAGNGTTAEFTTTLKDFATKRPTVPATPTTPPTGVREIAFIFLVTLDDGTEIRTMPVRIRVLA